MIRVTCSTIINPPIERVWSVLRDFNSHTAWHPVVAESIIEGDEPSDRVSCVGVFVCKSVQLSSAPCRRKKKPGSPAITAVTTSSSRAINYLPMRQCKRATAMARISLLMAWVNRRWARTNPPWRCLAIGLVPGRRVAHCRRLTPMYCSQRAQHFRFRRCCIAPAIPHD